MERMIHERMPQCGSGWLAELLGEARREDADIASDCDVAYSFNEDSVHADLLIDDLNPDFREHVNDKVADQHEFGCEHRCVDLESELLPIGRYSESFRGNFESVKGLAASVGLHAALLCLLLMSVFNTPTGMGLPGHGTVMVRLVSHEEDTPDTPCLGSIDSLPSVASKGGSREQAATEEATNSVLDVHRVSGSDALDHPESENEPRPERNSNTLARRERVSEEEHVEKGPNPYASAASVPSIAVVERRLTASAGTASPGFREEMLSAIMEAAYYPKTALGRNRHGRVLVAFAISRDGSVKSLRIAQQSGVEVLDQAALNIVRKASKRFPKLPETFMSESINYVVPIVFKETRSRVKE
jgi:protein TonB